MATPETSLTNSLVSRLRDEYVQQSARCGEEDSQERSLLAQEAADEIERLQAKIDALMLEYCPDEMTPEQRTEWAKHQRPSAEPSDGSRTTVEPASDYARSVKSI